MRTKTTKVKVGDESTTVKIKEPDSFKKIVVLANGAGANMDSPFMCFYHEALAEAGYCSVKFNFLYQARGKNAPDSNKKLEETWLKVLETIQKKYEANMARIVLGGKSMGGRIASQIAERASVKKLFFLGYPLHAPGKSNAIRDSHLYDIKARMLFIQGDRDKLADLEQLKGVVGKLKDAQLYVVQHGDHSLNVPRRSGLDQDQVFASTIKEIKRFVGR